MTPEEVYTELGRTYGTLRQTRGRLRGFWLVLVFQFVLRVHWPWHFGRFLWKHAHMLKVDRDATMRAAERYADTRVCASVVGWLLWLEQGKPR